VGSKSSLIDNKAELGKPVYLQKNVNKESRL